MKEVQRKGDFLTKEQRERLIREIISYFETEQSQEIGMLSAGEILDFFVLALGKDIYNYAIGNAKSTIRQSFENMEIDLELLSKK